MFPFKKINSFVQISKLVPKFKVNLVLEIEIHVSTVLLTKIFLKKAKKRRLSW